MNASPKFNINVVQAPNPILRVKTKPIKKITPEILKLVAEMGKLASSFKDPEGVGLASTQIGRDEALFVAKVGKTFKPFFNPKILSFGKSTKDFFEGCLSIPKFWGELKRPTSVTVSYMDETGKTVTRKLTGNLAWIFQHEVDHLNGTLFVDHVLGQKGKMYKVTGKDKTGADIFEEMKI